MSDAIHGPSSAPPPRRVPAAEPFDARLVKARSLSSNVRELTFERDDGKPLVFEPGQWLNLMVPCAEGDTKRAYSIASPPGVDNRFELAVTRVNAGSASLVLHEVEPGAVIRAVGPSGLFTRAADDAAPALLVGTGTGVTPLRSMILAALAARPDARLSLLFGVRREEDILYADELAALAAGHEGFEVFVTLSQGSPSWMGRRGYVQAHVGELWRELGDPEAHVFVCGLDRMVKSVRDVFRNELGVGRRQIHQERYD